MKIIRAISQEDYGGMTAPAPRPRIADTKTDTKGVKKGISGKVRAGGIGTQQQGSASRLRETGLDENSIVGALREGCSVKLCYPHRGSTAVLGVTGYNYTRYRTL